MIMVKIGKCKEALDNRANINSKHLRSNHSPLMNKNRTRLRNKFLKSFVS